MRTDAYALLKLYSCFIHALLIGQGSLLEDRTIKYHPSQSLPALRMSTLLHLVKTVVKRPQCGTSLLTNITIISYDLTPLAGMCAATWVLWARFIGLQKKAEEPKPKPPKKKKFGIF